MKIRRDAAAESAESGSRDEIRELAEALSLWRSAVHHVAARQTSAAMPHAAAPTRPFRLGLFLAPVLSAALAAGILLPIYSYVHHEHKTGQKPVAATETQPAAPAPAIADDTALMNQIDSEISEEVPDALQPLADLSEDATTNTTTSEKKNATQE